MFWSVYIQTLGYGLYAFQTARIMVCSFSLYLYSLGFHYSRVFYLSMMLDKRFKLDCQRAGVTIRTPPAGRFDGVLRQRHVQVWRFRPRSIFSFWRDCVLQLLGRSIDLNRLISQRINIALLKALDTAIWMFESAELSSIVVSIFFVSHLLKLLECFWPIILVRWSV